MQPAVLAFQKARGLPETGDIDAATIQAALGEQPTQADETIGNSPAKDNDAGKHINSDSKPNRPAGAMTDGELRQGERGQEVRELQERLNELGYTDAHGRPLRADSKFGRKTEEALEAFQRDHDLKVDGVAGSRTLDALKAPDPAKPRQEGTSPPTSTNGPLLSDPSHPDHDLYKQALKGIEKLGPEAGFKDQAERERAAATLTYEAKVSGMSKIDHVVPNASGTGLFAVQGALNDPAHQRVYADKTQAAQQPVDKTTEQLSQDAPRQNNAPSQTNQDQVKSMTV